MQVYVALCDVDGDFLVTKKRCFNNWWNKRAQPMQNGMPGLVNQAGQYSFPGGKANKNEAHISGSKREFEEETGMDFPLATHIQTYKKDNLYSLFVFKLTGSLVTVASQIRSDTGPNPSNGAQPTNTNIKDWELADAEIVPLSQLHSYLGVRQEVKDPRAKDAIKASSSRNFSQDIDWYGEMAEALQEHFQSGSAEIRL